MRSTFKCCNISGVSTWSRSGFTAWGAASDNVENELLLKLDIDPLRFTPATKNLPPVDLTSGPAADICFILFLDGKTAEIPATLVRPKDTGAWAPAEKSPVERKSPRYGATTMAPR
jgi:hypothetical protein